MSLPLLACKVFWTMSTNGSVSVLPFLHIRMLNGRLFAASGVHVTEAKAREAIDLLKGAIFQNPLMGEEAALKAKYGAQNTMSSASASADGYASKISRSASSVMHQGTQSASSLSGQAGKSASSLSGQAGKSASSVSGEAAKSASSVSSRASASASSVSGVANGQFPCSL